MDERRGGRRARSREADANAVAERSQVVILARCWTPKIQQIQ
jgi:hypothetical protein